MIPSNVSVPAGIRRSAITILAAIALVQTAAATIVTVLPGDPAWGNPSSENRTGGSSAITGTNPRNGDGSVELFGDRTRFIGLGNFYDPNSNLGLLSNVGQFTFDWCIALNSTTTLNADYTPALRLHVWDNGVRSELIWEGAYNGTYGHTTKGQWYTTGTGDRFHRYVAGTGPGSGDTLLNGALLNQSLASWISPTLYSANAYVSAVSIGVGSSASAGYHAFADNLTLGWLGGRSTTFNFDLTRPQAIPDAAATVALLGIALLVIALVARRRHSHTA
jgi:hypothetical protein